MKFNVLFLAIILLAVGCVTTRPIENNDPVIYVPRETIEGFVGNPISFNVSAVDADSGDVVLLRSLQVPAGATMMPGLPLQSADSVISTFTWVPADTGSFIAKFVVTDSNDSSDTGRVDLRVNPKVVDPTNNDPILLLPFEVTTVVAGHDISGVIKASDPDGDEITLSSGSYPAGMSFTPEIPASSDTSFTVIFAWSPTGADVGVHTIPFSLVDSKGASFVLGLTISVIEGSTSNHPHFDDEVQRLTGSGNLVYANAMRSEADLNKPEVNIRNDNANQRPFYNAAYDGIQNIITYGEPEMQIRFYWGEYWGPLWTQFEIMWDEEFLHQRSEPYSTKWWRWGDEFNESDERFLTFNHGMGTDAGFTARDGSHIVQMEGCDPENGINDSGAREVRLRYTASSPTFDYEPGGDTYRLREGRTDPCMNLEGKITWRWEPMKWYRVTVFFDNGRGEGTGRLHVWTQVVADPSGPQPLIKNIEYRVIGWDAQQQIDWTGWLFNSSGRQEGDWGQHNDVSGFLRNVIVSKDSIQFN